MPRTLEETHLPESDLVRLLDGELNAREQTRAEGHINSCSACQERLRTIEHRCIRLTSLLRESDWSAPTVSPAFAAQLERKSSPAPRTRNRPAETHWGRAAAIIAVLLAVGVVATPLPATVAQWVAERWSALTSPRANEPAASSYGSAPVQEVGRTRIQFVPEGDELFLEFATRQASGIVTVRSADVGMVSAEVARAGGASADLLVLPGGLRVHNMAESTADYIVIVPRTINAVSVRVGGDDLIVLPAAELADGRQLEVW
jgi:Flp pilus assembly pilin Flp